MQRPELLLLGLALRPDLAPQRETCPDRASARPANDTELAVSFSSTSSALRGAPRRRRRGSISSHSSYLGLGVQVGSDRRAVSTSLELSSHEGAMSNEQFWLAVGFVGQAFFSMRFVVQWINLYLIWRKPRRLAGADA